MSNKQTDLVDTENKVPSHLKQLFENSSEGKTFGQKQKLANLLTEYQDVFSINDKDLGKTDLGEHVIETGDAKPLKQPFRRVPLAFENEEKKALDKMLEQGIARPSNSPWSSPLLLTKKKDGSVRPCIEYLRLNKVTKVDAFRIPKS